MMTPVGLEHDFHPGHEVVQIGNVRQHVVADEEIGLFALRGQVSCACPCRRSRSESARCFSRADLRDIERPARCPARESRPVTKCWSR